MQKTAFCGWSVRGSNRHITKTLLVMKLTFFLLTACFLNVCAKGVSQNISFSGKNVPLSSVFSSVERQTGFVFIYTDRILKSAKPVSIKADNTPVEKFLSSVFSHQPLNFEISGRNVIVSRSLNITLRSKEFPGTGKDSAASTMAARDIEGMVSDMEGNPLPAANVRIRGKNRGTTTDNSGRFSLPDVSDNDVIEISFVGFETLSLKMNGSKLAVEENTERRKISASASTGLGTGRIFSPDLNGVYSIILSRSTSTLDESVVVAYGTTTQRFSTGSVASVRAAEIERQPVTNVLEALQGNVPGLFISRSNGNPGSQMGLSIRQQQSIQSRNFPLFIIDGVPFIQEPISSAGASGNIDPMNSINPADIASISVLKDADATAIYGSRGANGVILITTKKGSASEPRFDLNAYTGGGKVTSYLPMLNLSDYLAMRRTAFRNDNATPDFSNAPDLTIWDTTKSSDFLNDYIGNTARQTEVSGAFSGGSENLRYRFSNTYRKETTVYPGDWGYNRYSSHLSIDNTSRNGKFSLRTSAMYTKENNNQVSTDLTRVVYMLPPNYPVYNDNGSLNWTGGFTNPDSYQLQTAYFKSNNLLANTTLGYKIFPGLQATLSLGYNRISQTSETHLPKTSLNPNNSSGLSSATYSQDYAETYIIEPHLNYKKTLGNGQLNVLFGGTWQQTESAEPYFVRAEGFSNDRLMSTWTAASSITYKSSLFREYKYASVFGRLNYILDNKYVFNLNGRRDGSSRFGPSRQFGNFGSIGTGWIFSSEPWMEKVLPWLSYGKIRGSYGTTGNDQIPDYGYLATYGSLFYQYGSAGIYPLRNANPNYGWEANRKIDIGLETGFLNDRFFLSTSWFSSRTDNQLVNYPLSSQSGFSSFTGNMPALLQTSGWEVELKTNNIERKNFSWNSSFNITIPDNKLISFPGLKTTGYAYVYIEGESINTLRGFQYTGLKDGIATVADLNNDGIFTQSLFQTANGDYRIVSQSIPDFYGGFSNQFRLGRFQFDFLLQFVKQLKPSVRSSINTQPGGMSNQDDRILTEGFRLSAISSSETAFAYKNYYLRSDANYSDAGFIRLKNVNFSYELPVVWTQSIGVKSAGAFIRAQNLLTITNYLGFDPETGGAVLPPLRQISAGIHCSL